jgi:hypothetical protein
LFLTAPGTGIAVFLLQDRLYGIQVSLGLEADCFL